MSRRSTAWYTSTRWNVRYFSDIVFRGHNADSRIGWLGVPGSLHVRMKQMNAKVSWEWAG